MISIFTPVYNRAFILSNLYESLCRQTDKDFEWIVVDDGSTDGIHSLMARFEEEKKLRIKYATQKNGGKHRAINNGVKMAESDYFFIVDSDDFLKDDAVEWIHSKLSEISDENRFAGLSGLRVNPDGTKMGREDRFEVIDANSIEIRTRHHVTGELAEIYKTDVLRRFPFPEIEGEKFCSEGLVWSRIAESGLILRYYYHPLIVCEYRSDGLTVNRDKTRMRSPEYSMLLYSERIKGKLVPFREKIKSSLLFWRFSVGSSHSFLKKAGMLPWFGVPFCLPGMAWGFFTLRKEKK